MRLVIVEKPSVAMSIAKVIGANSKKDGYVEGGGYIVSWCVGHLVQMANPDKYDEKYAKWEISDLPIIPSEYLYEVSKYTKKQFQVLKKLLNDKNVDEVINACDAGREGELIFRLVYDMAKSKKTIKRLWISSLEDSAIKEGFENIKDGKLYENLYESAVARAKADWLIGMNLSRLYSCKYKQNYSVGRVQTPTLSMISERDNLIDNFKKEKYYTVEIVANDITFSTDRIDDESIANKLKDTIKESIVIDNVEEKEKITKPELPFDLTTLQRECNKYFGFSAKQTLDYAQSLYEKKLITYPRTDSRHLSDDMKNSVSKLFEDIYESNFCRCFNSSEVTDHHAIIITESSLKYDISTLQESERKVYELIKDKESAAFADNLVENSTKITVKHEEYEFKASGTVVASLGFRKYLDKYKKEKKEINLPKVENCDKFEVQKVSVEEKYTKPPQRFTEDTLLKAMEIAGKEDIDKDIEVEYPHHNLSSAHASLDKLDWGRPRQGLGTPATRAGIIENLIAKGLIERSKKNLIATSKGKSLISIVSDFLKEAKTTALWEMKLYDISKGKCTQKEFIDEISKEIRGLISQSM